MNVPAWPIPIHQTKLMIAKAHATGMLLPQRPMPVMTVYVSAAKSAKAPSAGGHERVLEPRPGPPERRQELVGQLQVAAALEEDRLAAGGLVARAGIEVERGRGHDRVSSGLGLMMRAR